MTVVASVKTCLASLKGAQASLSTLSQDAADEEASGLPRHLAGRSLQSRPLPLLKFKRRSQRRPLQRKGEWRNPFAFRL